MRSARTVRTDDVLPLGFKYVTGISICTQFLVLVSSYRVLKPSPVYTYNLSILVKIRFMEWINFLRRNLVSISFPTLSATLIFLDWNHTRKWKSQKKD